MQFRPMKCRAKRENPGAVSGWQKPYSAFLPGLSGLSSWAHLKTNAAFF
jgi:hypothetical protein